MAIQPQTIDMSSGDHGVILDDGTKIPYNQLQQTDPLLYKQYIEGQAQPGASLQSTQTGIQATQAQIPGIQATSSKEQIQAQQTASPINLSKDLSSRMTLPSALKKYSSLGMHPDSIFSQYLAESPWGLPEQNPQQLQQLGVSANALGQIGTPGSFMDRYNTKNSLEELRNLEKLWNKTNGGSRLEGMLGLSPDASAYDTYRTVVGQHLSSLIPGASGAQQSVLGLVDTLPRSSDISQDIPGNEGKAQSQFNALENALLTSKGYSHKDLGLSAPDNPSQGKGLLESLLGTAKNVTQDINAGVIANTTEGQRNKSADSAFQTAQSLENQASQTNDPIKKMSLLKQAQSLYTSTGQEAANVSKTFSPDVTKDPLLRGLGASSEIVSAAQLPFLAKNIATGGVSKISDLLGGGKSTGGDVAATFENAPSKLKQFLNPNGAKSTVGSIRDNLISTADKTGVTIPGENIANGIRQWANTAKLSNLPDAQAIEEAATNAEQQYAGKTFKPSDLKSIYDGIEKGYTKGGEPRSATAAYIDRNVQGVIAKNLESVAPGFQKTSDLFSQIFNAEKSPVKKMAGRAAGLGLAVSGLDEVRHILGM